MRIDKIISNREDHPSIIWHETRTETDHQQHNPDQYKEVVTSQKRIGKVLFVEKSLIPK